MNTLETPSAEELRQAAEAQAELPPPTYWPAMLALGLTAAAFGIIANGIFFYAGLVAVAIAIVQWIRLLLAEGHRSGEVAQGQPHEEGRS